MLKELPDLIVLYKIAEHLKSDGYEVKIEKNSLRIGYYNKMPDKYYSLYRTILIEEVDEDEDTGKLYTYRSTIY